MQKNRKNCIYGNIWPFEAQAIDEDLWFESENRIGDMHDQDIQMIIVNSFWNSLEMKIIIVLPE
jgi:hypothetical protein